MNIAGNYRLIALRDRIQKEFQELPGLHLTRWQAARLWSLEFAECDVLMKSLLSARILRETPHGYMAGDRCSASLQTPRTTVPSPPWEQANGPTCGGAG
jgi:hypothetical protein